MARSVGFNLGSSYPPNRQQHQQGANLVSNTGNSLKQSSINQHLLHCHGSDMFPFSHGMYHSDAWFKFTVYIDHLIQGVVISVMFH